MLIRTKAECFSWYIFFFKVLVRLLHSFKIVVKMSRVSSFIKSDTMMLSRASFLHLKIITGSHSFPKWIARCLGHGYNLKETVSQSIGRDAERRLN